MKVLIVLALVAAASCAPSERPKRNLFPAQYGAASPLITSDVQSNTLESSNYQTSALKSTSSKSSLVQPFQQVYQPTYAAAYQPSYQASYQPLYNYQQPSYYVAPRVQSLPVQTLPVQSQYYEPQVQYVSQPEVVYGGALSRQVQTLPAYQTYQPAYQPSYQLSGYNTGAIVNDPWC